MEAGGRVFLVLVLIAAVSSGIHAQTICNMPYAGMVACKPAATPPNPPPPTAACCAALSRADLGCLCSYRKSKLLPSLGIDPNLAMQLPTKCKLPHPAHC